MTYKNDNELMQKLFGMETRLPESTARMISDTCGSLEEKKVRAIFGGRLALTRRTIAAAAAAAVFTVFAGATLAVGIAHGGLFHTALGTGTPDNSESRVYVDNFGDEHLYPLFERFEVDETQAEKALGGYVAQLDGSYAQDGAVYTLKDFVIDENGVGYLGYTIENPDGLTDGQLHDAEPIILSASEKYGEMYADSRVTYDHDTATGTSAYAVEVFAIPYPFEECDGMTVKLGDSSFDLPIGNPVPAKDFSADGHLVAISPIGAAVKCTRDNGGECIAEEFVITSGADKYVVVSDSENISNKYFSLGWSLSVGAGDEGGYDLQTSSFVFNRLVIPEEVTSVVFESEHTGDRLQVQYAPYTTPANLPTVQENPFHYGRADGIEVFALTPDTVAACSEDDLKEFFAFTHDVASYEEIDVRDERVLSREHVMSYCGTVTGKLSEDLISADEAIDILLGVAEEYFPDERDNITSVALRLYQNDDGYGWSFIRSGLNVSGFAIDAQTGKVVEPTIKG